MGFLGKSPVASMFGITNDSWLSVPEAHADIVTEAERPRREIAPTFLLSAGQAHNTLSYDLREFDSANGFKDLSDKQHKQRRKNGSAKASSRIRQISGHKPKHRKTPTNNENNS